MTEPRPDPQSPKLIDIGDLAHLHKHYPPEALRQGVETIVTVVATLDASGAVVAATVPNESPGDKQFGFGAAACEVAKTTRWSNPRGTPAQVNLRVRFDLGKGTLPASQPGVFRPAKSSG